MTLALIENPDTFELIRDKIAAILVAEIVNQQALATAAGKDPDLWKLRIYTERTNAWEEWLNDQSDLSPIVNIWFSSGAPDQGSSNTFTKQTHETIYYLDCFGAGVSSAEGAGFAPGDKQAAENSHRALRLVRNILMANDNTYLDLRGSVFRRWPRLFETFQPEYDRASTAVDILGARLTLVVDHKELSPQAVYDVLEYLAITIKRNEDGLVYTTAEFDYTT